MEAKCLLRPSCRVGCQSVLETNHAGYRDHGTGTRFGRSKSGENRMAPHHLARRTGNRAVLTVDRPVRPKDGCSWWTDVTVVYGTRRSADRIRRSGCRCVGGGVLVGTFTESNGSEWNCLPALLVVLLIFPAKRPMVFFRDQSTFRPFPSSVFSVPTRGYGRCAARRCSGGAPPSRPTTPEPGVGSEFCFGAHRETGAR